MNAKKRTTKNLAFACRVAAKGSDNKYMTFDLNQAAAILEALPEVEVKDYPNEPKPKRRFPSFPRKRRSIIKKTLPKTKKERRAYPEKMGGVTIWNCEPEGLSVA